MKTLLAALCLFAAFTARPARAVEIEGVDPSGVLRTVGVTSTGRFQVDTSTGLSQHVVVDSGTISVQNVPGSPLIVTTTGGGAGGFTVTASTVGVTLTGQTSVTNVAAVIYPADTARVQGVVCNDDPNGLYMWIGGAGVTSATGKLVMAGSCFSPDVPSSFIGALYGVSTAPVSSSYIYFKP
ncbi:MAG: hypothetical protein KGI98_15980 [Euryarchaeota archaeon]|nr:hypothetical protein [Euryarchaeota archaeon]